MCMCFYFVLYLLLQGFIAHIVWSRENMEDKTAHFYSETQTDLIENEKLND